MRAGKMDRLATLKHRELSRNAHGEQVPTYTDYAEVWAEKLDLRGREFFSAQQTNAESTVKFRIRHRTDMVLTDRIVCEGNTYDIQQIAEIGRRDGLELIATARVP
jgi:SPP1 family predicted phage head-tail adaptor